MPDHEYAHAELLIAIEEPKLVLIMGCVGLALNVVVMSFLHGQSPPALSASYLLNMAPEHSHDHGHSHGHSHGHTHSHTHDDEQVLDGVSHRTHTHEEDSQQVPTTVDDRIEMESPPNSVSSLIHLGEQTCLISLIAHRPHRA